MHGELFAPWHEWCSCHMLPLHCCQPALASTRHLCTCPIPEQPTNSPLFTLPLCWLRPAGCPAAPGPAAAAAGVASWRGPRAAGVWEPRSPRVPPLPGSAPSARHMLHLRADSRRAQGVHAFAASIAPPAPTPTDCCSHSFIPPLHSPPACVRACVRVCVQAECSALRNMINCNVCHQRQKDVVITKCWHMFCNHCIQRNLGEGVGA